MLGFLCNQMVNLEIDAQTPYYSLLQKEITRTGHSPQKIFKSIDRSLRPRAMNYFASLWIFMCQKQRTQRYQNHCMICCNVSKKSKQISSE